MSKIILVTGSNSGIGFELVRLLAQMGHVVYLSARNVLSGKKSLESLHAVGLTSVKLVHMDVTDLSSVKNAADTIEAAEGRLDVLVNNAAISNMNKNQQASTLDVSVLKETMETNLYGLVQVTTMFIPLLRKSSQAVILNVASGLGSNSFLSRSEVVKATVPAYSASKAAVNSYTISLAQELREEGIKVNVVTPGVVSSRLNNFAQGGRTLEEGARSLLPFTILDKDGPTGKFFNWNGDEFSW